MSKKIPALIVATGLLLQTIAQTNLQTEHLTNPIGIDATMPRLSWQSIATKQTGYQLLIGTDSIHLQPLKKINSGEQQLLCKELQLLPFTKYYWKIKTWDEKQSMHLSSLAWFETGNSGWKGSWIIDTKDIKEKKAPFFKKEFSIKKTIASARVYIAAAGLYELSLNGKKTGDHVLDPMYTRFDRRTLYVTYDVTNDLKTGNNEIGVLLGNGWYNHQSTAVWYFDKAPWRSRPSFCLDLRLTYTDGSVETICSDETWKTVKSNIVFNSIYTAEHVDATWNDTMWKQVIYAAVPSQNIVAQSCVPIRKEEKLVPTSVKQFNDTDYVFDMGRNIAGVSEVTVSGEKGTIVKVKHGERLYKNGHVDISNIDVHYRPTDDTDPFQTDIYILKGEGKETFSPKFNYKGFQYAEVTSNKKITVDGMNAYFMHSDVSPVGKIQSSNEVVNKIWLAANHSYLSNLFGYPTDCPQREKNGWTGDAQINIETGLYNFDAITVYEKWMADHRDEQQPNGVLPSIVPTGGWGYEWGNGPDWTSTIAIIPWNLYMFYGDSKCLSDNYEHIKRYVDHINDLYPSGICEWGLGDWIPIKSKTPVNLTSTCYYYTDAVILSNAAKLFGKTGDYNKYKALAEKIKNAFNAKYSYTDSSTQTALAVSLFWKLVPESKIKFVADLLAKKVNRDGLDVGLLGTKAILNALSENGYADLAYQLASKTTYPSWGYWIANGATTLYENWPIDAQSDISMNHIMFGEISAWFYKALGGIKPDPSTPGFKNVLLEPHFVEGLNSFYCEHAGPYGTIISSWKRNGATINYDVTVPANSSATLMQQTGKKQTLLPGVYHFQY